MQYRNNFIYDIAHCVVIVYAKKNKYVILTEVFIQYVFFKFGMYPLVVIDDSNLFKDTFKAMYNFIHITYDVISNCKYKAYTVGRFRRFLNKAITMIDVNCCNIVIFKSTGIYVVCA